MHSTHSYDGKVSLAELRERLEAAGVSFACMSEHTDYLDAEQAKAFVEECHALSDKHFLFIPGFEVPYKHAHVLHFGCESFICSYASAEELQAWRKEADLVVLAHPVRNNYEVDELLLECIDGVEIWNQQYDGRKIPRIKSVDLLDSLRSKKDLLAVGGLDYHRIEHLGDPYTAVTAESLTREAIMSALQRGMYTFGSSSVVVDAATVWQPLFVHKLQSAVSTSSIGIGKSINKFLYKSGVPLPKSLVRLIRSRL